MAPLTYDVPGALSPYPIPSHPIRFVGDLLFGGMTPNDATSSAPKLNKAITGRRVNVDDAAHAELGGAGRGGGRASSSSSSSSGGRLPPPHALLPPPPPPLEEDEDEEEEGEESGAGRKRAADTDDDHDHDRMDDDGGGEGGGDYEDGGGGGHDHDGVDGHDEGEGGGGGGGGAEKQTAVLGRTLEGVMTSLETVASTEGEGGPELLALSVLSLGPDGEVNGEPGTGRVPSLFANHGFQVKFLGGGGDGDVGPSLLGVWRGRR